VASALVDAERRVQFEEEGAHYESAYFLTILYLPPAEDAARAERLRFEGRERGEAADAHEVLHGFDGGQNCESARQAIEAGANAIAAGSAIFGSPDYAAAIAAIRKASRPLARKLRS